jgi:uroporphyrinogen-III synthase
MRLIVTRPEPDDDRSARVLIRLGHEAILCPMLDIVSDPKAPIPRGPLQAVVVTSSNAVRALAARADDAVPRTLPLFAVGDQTALEAKRAAFTRARSAGGNLDDLVALLVAELQADAGPLLYAAGEVQAGDLAKRMQEHGFTVETSIVYRAEPRTHLSGVASDAIKSDSVDGVLLYSQRSAQAFAAALQAAGLAPLSEKVTLYCLSAAVAEPLGEVAAGKVLVAEAPNQISLFALIEEETGP